MPRNAGGPIAIVGMACRFPGADDVPRYWQLLRAGRHAFGPPPADRWDHAALFSEAQRTVDRYYAPHGAFVGDVRRFAAMEFGIPPRRVEVMDPQQRFTLEAASTALIDAGYGPAIDEVAGGRPLDRRRVGTFVGLSCTEYRNLMGARVTAAMMASGTLGEGAADADAAERMGRAVNRVVPSRAFSAPGALANMSAAAVAQELDLGGPAYTVDAACASALVAVHDAMTFLRAGQIDAAVAGGVYLNLTPDNLIAFSRIGAISASGVCRPFDARADGFVQGEGVGMVVLKRLEDAIAAGDRIYAVIRGTGCNNDGRGDGPMSPRAEGQVEVIGQAWEDAGITGADVGYVEAHGTGTSVGDRTELTALRTMLRGRERPVALGSAKANIGHTMSAAGIAGLMKAVLAVHHREVPPLANWTAPHPDHDLDDGAFTVPTEARAWEGRRVATVSSFGFGGTNAHVVLEEAPPAERPARIFPAAFVPPRLPAQLVVVSAESPELLARHCRDLADTVPDAESLAAVAHTLNVGRKRRAIRVAVVASTLAELATRLRKAADALAKDPATRGNVDRDTVIGDAKAALPVALLCPGQGMQKVGLMRDWLAFPEMAEALAEAERDVADLTSRPLRDYLYGADATDEALTDTAIAQPAMFAIGLGVARVLARFGVTGDVALGHSLGEFTAAALSGAVSPRDAIRFVATRGRAMSDLPGDHGAMAAVMAAAEDILPHLPATVGIANRNHPRQNVLSGPTEAVDIAVSRLTEAGMKAKRIPVSHAFHSPLLEGVQPVVERLLRETTFRAPERPMASCIAATAPTTAEDVRAIFARHATAPVDYVRGLGQCRDAGARLYVQLCTGGTLAAFAKGGAEDAVAIASVGEEGDGGLGLLRILALCAAHGHRVELSAFGEGLASLPPTPLQTQEYWAVQEKVQKGSGFAHARNAAAAASPEAPSLAAPESAAEDDLRDRVLRAVSRVSAFPLDALKAEQRLLEDLGFDSLMVAELSTRITEAVPGFPGLPRALFATSPTVDDIVRHVEGGAVAEDVPLTDPAKAWGAYRPVLVPAPLSGLTREGEARVLVCPSLDTLRKLPPGDVVVVTGPLLGEDPEVGAVAGFVKALAREWPRHKVCVVDGTEADARREAAAAERDAEVVWKDGARFVVGLEPVAAAPRDVRGQRVLISGGTGWLGRVLARALIDAGASVVLTGSREDAGDALAALGAAATYVRADLSGALPPFGKIDGIVHAAGVLADGPVGSADGAKATAIKVEGLRKLAAACPGAWVTAIGSWAGRFGNAYQTEYAAANEAMAYAARGLGASVQAWGPWAGSDMVETIPAAMKRAMREDGVLFVDTAQGARAFVAHLGGAGELVMGADLPRARRAIEAEETLTPEQIWLRDHALMGRPTVAMAMVLEWAARLGGDTVEDLTLYDGVVVEKPTRVRRRLDGERFTVTVGDRVAWRGTVRTTGTIPAAPAVSGDAEAPTLTVPDFYAEHTFHGPALQGLLRVGQVGARHITGRVKVGSAAAWGQDAWTFSPLAIDSAFQLCAWYAVTKLGRAGFPVRVARWTQRPLDGATELDVVATFEAAEGDRFRGTVALIAPDGRVVGLAEGIEAELREKPGTLSIPEAFTDFAKLPAWIDLDQRLQAALMLGISNPYFKVLEGTARDVVSIAGKEHVHFSGYNYLGFSGHPYVAQRVADAVERYGTSVSASRVASGERPIHLELEARIAAALGVEASLVFTAGHATNVTTIGHLFGPKDLILHDELIHDSALQGMKLSGAARRPFPHGDTAALARLLEQLRPNFEKCLIIVEGVYSMDGDVCDLPAVVALKKRHKAFLMVDEAHSFGVVGKTGYGVAEHFGVPGTDIDIWMGTLSKSLSSCGGYIAGSRVLIELLKYTAPGFVYSAGLTPANTAAALASLELMEREPEHVAKLQSNARFFYEACRARGLDCGPSAGESAVVPVVVGNSFHALLLSDAVFQRGVNVQPILYPAVADNASRLRFFLSSLHSEAQLAWTAEVVAEELGRIRRENGGV